LSSGSNNQTYSRKIENRRAGSGLARPPRPFDSPRLCSAGIGSLRPGVAGGLHLCMQRRNAVRCDATRPVQARRQFRSRRAEAERDVPEQARGNSRTAAIGRQMRRFWIKRRRCGCARGQPKCRFNQYEPCIASSVQRGVQESLVNISSYDPAKPIAVFPEPVVILWERRHCGL